MPMLKAASRAKKTANGPHNGPQEKSAWGPLVAKRF
jgi:hypothetical protein